jgi:hypothetical protein
MAAARTPNAKPIDSFIRCYSAFRLPVLALAYYKLSARTSRVTLRGSADLCLNLVKQVQNIWEGLAALILIDNAPILPSDGPNTLDPKCFEPEKNFGVGGT